MRARKLTDAQVELVRAVAKQRRETPTNAEMAAEWGVSKRLIDAISQGREYVNHDNFSRAPRRTHMMGGF